MRDMEIYQGQTIRQSVTVEDDGAVTATFVATDGATNLIEETFTFIDKTAQMNILNTNIPGGSYDYYIRIDWDDGSVDYLPDSSNCNDGECDFPQLIICEIPQTS